MKDALRPILSGKEHRARARIEGGVFCTTFLGLTTLWMAILADTGATVLVTANAFRLPGWKMTNPRRS